MQTKLPAKSSSQTAPVPVLQPKLTVNQPGDAYEQEADSVAEEIMGMSDGVGHAGLSGSGSAGDGAPNRPGVGLPDLQRKCAKCEAEEKEEEVHRKESGGDLPRLQRKCSHCEDEEKEEHTQRKESGGGSSAVSPAVHETLKSPGHALDRPTQAFMEERFGHDFGTVRIHNDPTAQRSAGDINALAYTSQQHIVFGPGQFAPKTDMGKKLLAHELTHVLQQDGGGTMIRRKADHPSEHQASRFIIEDGGLPATGQMRKSQFLHLLNEDVCKTVDHGLKGTKHSSDNCPYIKAAFAKHQDSSPAELEQLLARYAPESRQAKSAADFISLIQARVMKAVIYWKKTGEVPADIPQIVMNELSATKGAKPGREKNKLAKSISFKAQEGGAHANREPQSVMDSLGKGTSMESATRSRMEAAFGTNLSDVELHTDGHAAGLSRDMNARAFAVGNHIAFNDGEYRPGTLIGDALMAHELAHVAQQRDARESGQNLSKGGGAYESMEQEADLSAVAATASIWGSAGRFPKALSKKYLPRLKSGLRLQACKNTAAKECPKGYRWGVAAPPVGAFYKCYCTWRCLETHEPARDGFTDEPVTGVQCEGPCHNHVDKNYSLEGEEDPGSVTNDGALMQAGGESTCGCISMDMEGNRDGKDPRKQKMPNPPPQPVGIDLGGLAGAVVSGRASRYMPPEIERDPVAQTRPAEVQPEAPKPSDVPTVQPPAVVTPPPQETNAPPAPANSGTVPGALQGPVAPAETSAKPAQSPATAAQPKWIQDILDKNAPARKPEEQQKLVNDMARFRLRSGIPRVDDPETQGVDVEGGTVAAARTDIPTLENLVFGGASPNAMPEALKGKPGTSGGSYLPPANPLSTNHAEQVALENVRIAIEKGLASQTITRQDLVGKTVSLRVEQEPCSSCASHLNNPDATPGVIEYFHRLFPELSIEVRNNRTSRSYYIEGKPSKGDEHPTKGDKK